MPDSKLVGTAKPKITGGILIGPAGSTLPVDAVAAPDAAIKAMGYIGEEGFELDPSKEIEKFKAWGGAVVHRSQTEFSEAGKFTFLESANADVLKEVYGTANVTVTGTGAATTIAVKHNDAELPPRVLIADIVAGSRPRRVVVPLAAMSLAGSVKYAGGDLIKYEMEFDALPDASGNNAYEYLAAPAV